MRLPLLLVLTLPFVMLAACGGGETAAPAAPATAEPIASAVPSPISYNSLLAGKKFILTQVNGANYNKENLPFIEFDEQASLLFGKVCNSFRGSVEWTEDSPMLIMKNAASTQMACIDGELAALEKLIFRMLAEGARPAIGNDPSILHLEQGGDTLTFKLSDPAVG